MTDTGFTQINDIILDIPPSQIQVNRDSHNHRYQTLRTRSSTKVKSGFSDVDITMSIKFVPDPPYSSDPDIVAHNGYEKLSDLISQLKVTPFCYIDNDLIRNSVLGGSPGTMALAVRQMSVYKQAESNSDVIEVNLSFSWFNYYPFSQSFSYKRDVFSPDEVSNPRNSDAWKLMYQAEQRKAVEEGREYLKTRTLGGKTSFLSFKQYVNLKKQAYRALERDVDALRNLEDHLLGNVGEGDIEGPFSNNIKDVLLRSLSKAEAESLYSEMFGRMTSMHESLTEASREKLINQILSIIGENIGFETASKYDVIVNESQWKAVLTKTGLPLRTKLTPQDNFVLHQSKKTIHQIEGDGDEILLTRNRELPIGEQTNLTIVGINISFENTLATLSLTGHQLPTFQHIGSIDSTVSISFLTTDENDVKRLSDFYSLAENQAYSFKNVPAGARNLRVHNDLINMCGLHEFLSEELNWMSVPGMPGTYSGSMVLVENPITSATREGLSVGQGFMSRADIRAKIAKILTDNLGAIDKDFSELNISPGGLIQTDAFETSTLVIPGEGGRSQSVATRKWVSLFAYTGAKKGRSDQFAKLVEDFAGPFGGAFSKIFSAIKKGPLALKSIDMQAFYALSDQDVPGIEKLQELLLPPRETLEEKRRVALSSISIWSSHAETQWNDARDRKRKSFRDGDADVFIQDRAIDWAGKVGEFINRVLNEYIEFSVDFLDRIIFSGALSLPQFSDIKKEMEGNLQTIETDNYPDLPLKQVIDIMSEAKEGSFRRETYDNLLETAKKKKFGLKNSGLSSLINPDFFYYDASRDALGTIISPALIKTVSEGVVNAQGHPRIQAETSWFDGIYATDIIGKERAGKIEEERVNQSRDSRFWKESENEGEVSIQKSIRDQMATDPAFYPNDLRDVDDSGLGCSIYEAANSSREDYDAISVKGIGLGSESTDTNFADDFGTYSSRRDPVSLAPADHSGEVRHIFSPESILALKESSFVPVEKFDPNKTPKFTHPCPPQCQRVSRGNSLGKKVRHPLQAEPRVHEGTDYATAIKGKARGLSVKTAALGKVVAVSYSETESERGIPFGGEGVRVQVRHANGWLTKYYHLQWDDFMIEFSKKFWRGGKPNPFDIPAGTQIGNIGNTGGSKGPHLHFETWFNGKNVDAEDVLKDFYNKSQGPFLTSDPKNESLLTRSVDQFERDLKTSQGFGMRRAFPTFRLYFIESDLGERKRFGFDDFYSYSAIKDIQVIRDRKNPADLARITMTNVSGALSNRKFKNSAYPAEAFDEHGRVIEEDPKRRILKNTPNENPISSLMLQPGTQMQLKLGYDSNPEELESVMNGVITEVRFSENDDLVQIACQSFGIELVHNIHGEAKSYGGILSRASRTANLLEELMAFPEVTHFGRWTKGIASQAFRGVITNKYTFNPRPADDNIFAPSGRGVYGIFDSSPVYVLYQSTIWDVLQEVCLRHPSYVAYPVPYEGFFGPRMTMYFGVPDQNYFSRDPTFQEIDDKESIRKAVTEATEALEDSQTFVERIKNAAEELDDSDALRISTQRSRSLNIGRDALIKETSRIYALKAGLIKPFRNYHVATSALHIIDNSIESVSHNSFNTVTLQYGGGGITGTNGPSVNDDLGVLEFDNLKTFTLRADAGIADENVREMFAQYPNCLGVEMAKRYSLGLLKESLANGYKGSLTLMGNPSIKPHDVVYVFDEYSDMFGPVEVEMVVHSFNQTTGFVTEVVPDLMVHVNQATTMSTADAMGLIVEAGIKKIGMPPLSALSPSGSLYPGDRAVAAGAVSLIAGSVGSAAIAAAPASTALGAFAGSVAAGAATAGTAAAAVGTAALAAAPVVAAVVGATTIGFTPIANMFFNSSENALGQGGNKNLFGLVGTFIFRKLITRTQFAHPFRYTPLVKNGKAMVGGLPNKETDGSFSVALNRWFKDREANTGLWLDDTYDSMHVSGWFGGESEGSLSDAFWGESK